MHANEWKLKGVVHQMQKFPLYDRPFIVSIVFRAVFSKQILPIILMHGPVDMEIV